MDIEKVKRRLDKLRKRRDEMAQQHNGREQEYTYHGGYSLGYLEGRISAFESVLDTIYDNKLENENG